MPYVYFIGTYERPHSQRRSTVCENQFVAGLSSIGTQSTGAVIDVLLTSVFVFSSSSSGSFKARTTIVKKMATTTPIKAPAMMSLAWCLLSNSREMQTNLFFKK